MRMRIPTPRLPRPGRRTPAALALAAAALGAAVAVSTATTAGTAATTVDRAANVGYQAHPGTVTEHASADVCHQGKNYCYTYTWKIGPVSATGSPQHAMHVFGSEPEAIFPFQVSPNCARIVDGETCTLYPAGVLLHGVGDVLVRVLSPTSFMFVVKSKGYFDAPGSNITFTLATQRDTLTLTQHGVAIGPDWASQTGYAQGIVKETWIQQALNLAKALGANCGSDLTRRPSFQCWWPNGQEAPAP